ncbi:MAG: UDP-N-acetylmuramate dehydrogenase [Bdellovibrionales bacterium]|nr:UDP-N-acetylmuramate dehydrogenase [Bdellovibrionales bacterium]
MALISDFLADLRGTQGQFRGEVEFDPPLSRVVYYRIGGQASVMITPRAFSDLELIHGLLRRNPVPFFVMGWGSNLLFPDHGFQGLMIRMKHLFTEVEEIEEGRLRVGASVGANVLLKVAAEKGYGGLHRFTGIPGSVGGMVAMNAGTHEGEMSDVILRSEWVNLTEDSDSLQVHSRVHEVGDFSYRRNHFLQPHDLLTHIEIRYEPEEPARVKSKIDELYQRRKASQPVEYPSCGSVFMNPKAHGLRAWEVVEKLGLRGHQIGNAQVSEKHPNFIVNLGGATSSDVRALIDLIKSRALSELGIELHEEVRILS